ncbi:hypothetical protein Vadar_008479 [Vaccinium darrowii]|uniref:Uncharacterized protein n=1 Tax=Vaccinium darrowii TaxID=229202 RepID=A0ACB7WZG6_9ERIC|nr:hypothetical protein Vadar_008479 [Vaccinium darrowii]
MALRTTMLKSAWEKMMSIYGPIRWAHTIAAQPPPLDVSMSPVAVTGPFVLPEHGRDSEYSNGNVAFEFPSFTFGGGSMELMAQPQRKPPFCSDNSFAFFPQISRANTVFSTTAHCAPTMALRTTMLKSARELMMSVYGPIRWAHTIAAQPPPLDVSMSPVAVTGPFVLPEHGRDSEYSNGNVGFEFPSFTFGGGSMELMAVPKKKVSPHKRGIRNGPKALKPVPVIVRCKSCGRVKLPHFYCCSGDRGNTGEPNSSSS